MLNPKKLVFLLSTLTAVAGCSGGRPDGEFVSEELGGNGRLAAEDGAASGAGGAAAAPSAPGAPKGRMGEVQEADIYRVVGNTLYYFNTYRGLIIYDISNPKQPVRLSRVPVYGYPIEMFVDNGTVYALLRDALYLTQSDEGKVRFERRHVSQLVAIDATDVRAPKILTTTDILGELREGVSRKIEDTIYVVSYVPQSYYWGWQDPSLTPQKEQAWVYSFNVADAKSPRLVQKLKIFEGGSVDVQDPKTGTYINKSFSGVTIAATANALMVVENWYAWASISNGRGCGYYNNDQEAVVSIIDISDPAGAIRLHTRFSTAGALSDQFKQTYVYDDATKAGTYYGIFARNVWSGSNCQGTFFTQNSLESWDITDGANPARLDALDFGKPEETVRGSTFDVGRKVAFAITARNIDPFYAFDIANPRDLRKLSEIDGLSGDMNVFRPIDGGNFLLAIGRDNSDACVGFGGQGGLWSANVAVSIIDVRNPAAAKLVQRRCVTIQNAEWVGSAVNWDLDQGHKMIGLHSDATANVVTVPVYYYSRSDQDDWWWYRYQTAVGIMSWDLSKYDERVPLAQRTVLTSHGTFIHPEGEVRRSIVFSQDQNGTPTRMMLNLSDTHMSMANLTDLDQPKLESVTEIAPYLSEIFRFGDYIVEHVRPDGRYGWTASRSEFRVKRAGGDLDDTAPAATLAMGQVQRVLKHGDSLVLFRTIVDATPGAIKGDGDYSNQAVVVSFTDPTRPRVLSRVTVPQNLMPYYYFWCGDYWGGYWFDKQGSNFAITDRALVFLHQSWEARPGTRDGGLVVTKLWSLDLADPTQPRVTEDTVDVAAEWGFFGLVGDGADPRGFYLSYKLPAGEVKRGDYTFQLYKSYARRFAWSGAGYAGGAPINVPGRLVRAWNDARGARLLLTQDNTYRLEQRKEEGQTYTYYAPDVRLHLLRQDDGGAQPVARLLDQRTFTDAYVHDLMFVGDRIVLGASPSRGHYGWWGWGRGGVAVDAPAVGGGVAFAAQTVAEDLSDRLIILDVSGNKLAPLYDEATGTWSAQFMGTAGTRLFVNLAGDGVLVVDVADPRSPQGVGFIRTLGWATHVEVVGDLAYVASGYFGTYRVDMSPAVRLPPTRALASLF